MERFSTLTKRAIAPALMIALTAGSALARPGHYAAAAHHGAKISHSETARGTAHEATDMTTTVTGKIVNLIANLSPLDVTQDVGSSKVVPPVNHAATPSPIETMQDAGAGTVDASGKRLQSQKASGDFYLDGEAHFQSAPTIQNTGLAEPNKHVGDTDGTIKQDAEQKVQDMSGSQYLNAIAEAAGGVLKFKQWQDNPNKPPIGRP
ncbi:MULTISPECIES: hypothetical protein [unclassified Ruegeria]|uniref:hypothetical protein n=1 Tax=unclassified Ruegeria TaxID=2625375 RepID=UPI0014878605|nr:MULTISPECIES: hypothetical protein [unclassified Ruegeria]NOD77579.1 hypothetical protein [Ruegeria sp. HKCCD4332]